MSSIATSARLGHLESAGLIQLAALLPELEYVFRHILVKEAAYASLVKGDRRGLHLLAAQSLERLYVGEGRPPRLDVLPVLAHHFAEAGDHEPAARYFTQAGDAAARVYANVEAITHYSRAIELVQPLAEAHEQVAYLYARRGRALEVTGQLQAAIDNYLALEALGRERGQPALELEALILRAIVLAIPSVVTDVEEAGSLSLAAVEMARKLKSPVAETRALWALMLSELFSGHLAEAVAHGQAALPLARGLGQRELIALILNDLGRAHMNSGNLPAALEATEEACRLWRAEGNLVMLADCVSNLASTKFFGGDLAEALALLQESQALSRQAANEWGQAYSLMMQGFLYLELGDVDEALARAEECVRLSARGGFLFSQVVVRANLGLIYSMLGRPQQGLALAQEAMADVDSHAMQLRDEVVPILARIHGDLDDWDRSAALLAEPRLPINPDDRLASGPLIAAIAECNLALARGDPAQAVAIAQAAVGANSGTGMQPFLAQIVIAWAQALRQLGRLDEAAARLSEMQAVPTVRQSRITQWQLLSEMAALAESSGQTDQLRALRAAARPHVDYIAAHLSDPSLRASFLGLPEVRVVLGG